MRAALMKVVIWMIIGLLHCEINGRFARTAHPNTHGCMYAVGCHACAINWGKLTPGHRRQKLVFSRALVCADAGNHGIGSTHHFHVGEQPGI